MMNMMCHNKKNWTWLGLADLAGKVQGTVSQDEYA